MITMVHQGDATLQTGIMEYRGLSTDTKPADSIKNGSVFFEIDTQNVYMFDSANQIWVQIG